jgi:DNA processing protein
MIKWRRNMDELFYKLWFTGLKMKDALKLELINSGISPEMLFHMDEREYVSLGINLIEAQDIKNYKIAKACEETCEYINKEDIKILMYTDQDYPEQLRNIYDPPPALFVKGTLIGFDNCLAVVGARKASDYGKSAAYKLSMELAVRGITIISGLARGIDSCAHQGCLDGEGTTAAVMGSGFKHVYPTQNKRLFEEICSNGCVISEYLPDMPPYAGNFPRRNRIISGISKGVIIVEAGEKSGSLITARLALEQGRDVFAVPGNIFSPSSQGTNSLIKDGAKPVTCVGDILEEYGVVSVEMKGFQMDERENSVYEVIKGGGGTIDGLSVMLPKMKIEELLAVLSTLECKGAVKRVYGGYYIC